MIIFECKNCGKTWEGKTEHEVEVNAELHPCKCQLEVNKMSMEELLNKINGK